MVGKMKTLNQVTIRKHWWIRLLIRNIASRKNYEVHEEEVVMSDQGGNRVGKRHLVLPSLGDDTHPSSKEELDPGR